jgi:hypothetical protein
MRSLIRIRKLLSLITGIFRAKRRTFAESRAVIASKMSSVRSQINTAVSLSVTHFISYFGVLFLTYCHVSFVFSVETRDYDQVNISHCFPNRQFPSLLLSAALSGKVIGDRLLYRHSATYAIVRLQNLRHKSNFFQSGLQYTVGHLRLYRLYKAVQSKSKFSTHFNLIGHRIAPLPVLQPSSILSPPLSHCTLSPARKNSARI